VKIDVHVLRFNSNPESLMINRRDFLGMAAGAGAGLALSPELLRALQLQQTGKLLQRAIPSSGEMLPVISFAPRSLGGFAMSSQPGDVAAIKAVLKTFMDNGGKFVDVLHGAAAGEESARTAAGELGINDKFFWTTPLQVAPAGRGAPPPDAAALRASMEEKFAKFKVKKIDLVMVGSGADMPMYLGVLRELKKEGRVRYIGVHHLAFPANSPTPAFGPLEAVMRNEQVDFVATDYSVGDRRVEETILPLALEKKIAFMSYFSFDRGRIFKRIGTTPLPAWAAEFDAKTWAQFCIKYVLSHPAVVVAREGTTDPVHMLDNIGGGIGRLPNEAMRKRMAELVDSLPPAAPGPLKAVELSPAVLDRYVGEYTTPDGTVFSFRRDGATLFMKPPGAQPEVPLAARAEIRFGTPQGRVVEFHADGQGKVTGAFIESGPQPLKLVRK
jgi:aryl-alcohol dehydrogenase-like predicted oxidoreductase